MYEADLHIHSTFSVDGGATLRDMADSACRAGLRTVCFAEHVDHNPRDTGYGFYDPTAYREAFLRVRDEFGDRLEILWGIEFAEPHLYPAEFERELARGYDMVIGSQHFLGEWFFGEREMLEKWPREELFARYYAELEAMADRGGFDVMGHIGFPCRYIGDHAMPEDAARSLARKLVKSGIVPEINTSGFRKGYLKTMPDDAFLRIWREESDGCVTVGSDAHRVGEPGSGRAEAERAVREHALVPVVFRGRKAVRP